MLHVLNESKNHLFLILIQLLSFGESKESVVRWHIIYPRRKIAPRVIELKTASAITTNILCEQRLRTVYSPTHGDCFVLIS